MIRPANAIDAEVYAAYLRSRQARPALLLDEFLAERQAAGINPGINPPNASGNIPSHESATPAGRTVQRVSTGRMHRNLVRDPAWGGRALTGTEARWYDDHRGEYRHVDVHPVVTLHGGIRYVADFLAWPPRETCDPPQLVDVKASEKHARATEIQRVAALCREHPLGPLVVTWWDRAAREWRRL